jgi:hypothetical protein
MIRYYKSFGYDGKVALNTIFVDLMHVVYLQKTDHYSHQASHMTLGDQHSRAHSCP